MLEAGCGSGARMVSLAKVGLQVMGEDVDTPGAHHAKSCHGVSALAGEPHASELPVESLTRIFLNQVLEHLFDPIRVMQECLRLLNPGGRLVAVTPNIRSLGFRNLYTWQISLDAPRNLQHPDREPLLSLTQPVGFTALIPLTSPAQAEPTAFRRTPGLGEEVELIASKPWEGGLPSLGHGSVQ
jgi:SAM-dependent methyltransferase